MTSLDPSLNPSSYLYPLTLFQSLVLAKTLALALTGARGGMDEVPRESESASETFWRQYDAVRLGRRVPKPTMSFGELRVARNPLACALRVYG